MKRIRVQLERGDKKTFASALDWPGWSRSSRSEEEALAALVDYGPRYARVVSRTRTGFEPPKDAHAFEVVERVRGGGGTDFGVPSVPARSDHEPLDGPELSRLRRILEASWRAVDRAIAGAAGVELRKGPRGGGRDVDRIRDHVLEAERAYLHTLGGRVPKGRDDDMATVRAISVETLEARAHGRPVSSPSGARKRWPIRYFVRRSAWHALDHAWEIEDRSTPDAD